MADSESRESWPGHRTVANLCGLSDPTVRRAIRALRSVGLLATEARYDEDGRQRSNVYVLRSPESTGGVTSDQGEGVTSDQGRGSPVTTLEQDSLEQDPDEQDRNPPIVPPPGGRVAKVDDGFDAFWAAYPNKVGKKAAQKAWKKHRPPLDACLRALEWQSKTVKWITGFIPNPATWINRGSWEDEPSLATEGVVSESTARNAASVNLALAIYRRRVGERRYLDDRNRDRRTGDESE